MNRLEKAIFIFLIYLLASCTSKTPVDYSTEWTLLQTSITYAPDNTNEASRTDNEFDSSGRLIKITKKINDSIVSLSHEYVYSDHLLTYTQNQYKNGQVTLTTKYKIKYMDPYWSKPDTILTYSADGLTETGRTEYSYDSQYRKIGIVKKLKSLVVSKSLNYNYSVKSVDYTTINFALNGDTISKTKYKETYFDGNGLKLQSRIVYASDNTTEDSKLENSYDSVGRLVESSNYGKNILLISKSRDYQYSGKEVTFLTDYYTNKVVNSTDKKKYIYYK
jgi:hypothetical protein